MHTTRGRDVTPVGAVARGLAAGALGTLAMDLLWYARYRREDGKSRFAHWEFSGDVLSWDAAPAPAVVGKRLVEGLLQVELADHRAGLTNNVTHWGYGMLMGAQYGLLAGSLRGRHLWLGLPFGAAVWGSSYVVLPAAGLYKPIWQYDRRTLTKDLTAHLVFGLGTAVGFAALAGQRGRAA